MGLFSRKSDLPEIPRSRTLPEFRSSKDFESHHSSELPTIPSNKSNDNLNEDLIKSAMDDKSENSDLDDESETPEVNEVIKNDSHHSMRAGRIPMPPSYNPRPTNLPQTGRPTRDTIFVKIDKFNNAQETLIDVEAKIKDLAAEVQTLKKIKMQEIDELNEWDEELKKVNDRLSKIDTNIFGEV